MAANLPRRFFATPLTFVASACASEVAHPISNERSWTVTKEGDACASEANTDLTCPRGASCNPPAPRTYACPAEIKTFPAKVVRHSAGAECKVETTTPDGMHEESVPCPE
jgi:hypothetical protein